MTEYHKIQSLFLRDPETKHKRLLMGQYAHPAFEYLAGNEWTFTEKVDGTNVRVIISNVTQNSIADVTFSGKTEESQIPAKLVKRLQERFIQNPKLAEVFPDGAVLYGEGYGHGIQKAGPNYRPDQDFVLFDVRCGDWWLERENVEDVATKLGLDVVPVIGTGTLHEMIERVKAGFVSAVGEMPTENFQAEGIVARPRCELKTRNGERIITKLKYKDFAR